MGKYVDVEIVKAIVLNDRLLQGNAEWTLYQQRVDEWIDRLPTINLEDYIPRNYYEKVVEELCHKHTEEIESLMAERSEDEDRIRESQRIPKDI